MSRMAVKEIHTVKDIWVAYAIRLLNENPDWWSVYSCSYKVSHCFIYRKVGTRVEEVMSYPRFRKTIETYFTRAKQSIIQGEALNIRSSVGKICAKRVERDFRKKGQRNVNWQKTKQQPLVWNEEKQKMVYAKIIFYVNKDWCRISWSKNGHVKNETMYEFTPANRNSDGTSGFKLEFTQALEKDPFLKYKYLFNPIRP